MIVIKGVYQVARRLPVWEMITHSEPFTIKPLILLKHDKSMSDESRIVTKALIEMQKTAGTDVVCQAIIDMIYHMDATNADNKWSAHLLACAIKELMIHKDSQYLGKDYVGEKVGKAMREIDMPVQWV